MLDLAEYQKIMDDPLAELDSLWKRLISWRQDSQHIIDHTLYHFVNMASGVLFRMGEEFRMSVANLEYAAGQPDLHELTRKQWTTQHNVQQVMVTQILAVIREELDALDAKKEKIRASGEIVLKDAAEQIRGELVCCDIYERLSALYDRNNMEPIRELRRSPEYHAVCYHGEWSARIAENLA